MYDELQPIEKQRIKEKILRPLFCFLVLPDVSGLLSARDDVSWYIGICNFICSDRGKSYDKDELISIVELADLCQNQRTVNVERR